MSDTEADLAGLRDEEAAAERRYRAMVGMDLAIAVRRRRARANRAALADPGDERGQG